MYSLHASDGLSFEKQLFKQLKQLFEHLKMLFKQLLKQLKQLFGHLKILFKQVLKKVMMQFVLTSLTLVSLSSNECSSEMLSANVELMLSGSLSS